MAFGNFSSKNSAPINDINIVPLVDILLVLLVVLIVTTPLLMHGVNVNLPKTSAPSLKQAELPITLVIHSDGSLMLDSKKIENQTLAELLTEKTKQEPNPQLLINADLNTPYDYIAKAMALAAEAGITKIGFVNNSNDR